MASSRSRLPVLVLLLLSLLLLPSAPAAHHPVAGPDDAPGVSLASAETALTSREVSSDLVRVGPGHWSLSGRVRPGGAGQRVLLNRRRCDDCAWETVVRSRTGSRGRFRFAIDAPGRTTVVYRVRAPRTSRFRAAVSRGYRVSPMAANRRVQLSGWGRPAWRDEFNTASVDETKWDVHDRDYMSWDVASLYARQVSTRDGKLVIRAERTDPERDTYGRAWASGYLDTQGGRFAQRYGRFEILARVPTTRYRSRGLWPSFWLRDERGSGEIDVMEAWGTPSSRPEEEDPGNYVWTVHEDTYGGGERVGRFALPRNSPTIADGFHRYGVVWGPSRVRFLFDGETVGRVLASAHPWLVSSFPSKVHLRLQLAVGSSYWGLPDTETRSPAEYVIEYVRVWSRS